MPRINWTHPLAQGLVLYCPAFEGGGARALDLAYGVAGATETTNGWTIDAGGTGLNCTTSAGAWWHWGNQVQYQFTHATNFTLFSRFITNAGSGVSRNMLRKDPEQSSRNLYLLRVNTANVVQFQYGSTSASLGSVAGSSTISLNTQYDAMGVRTVGSAPKVYVNGQLDGTGSGDATGTWTVDGGRLGTGSDSVGSGILQPFQGAIRIQAAWVRDLSAAEAAQWSADPYQILEFPPDIVALAAALGVTPAEAFAIVRNGFPFGDGFPGRSRGIV
jgi:hypothetical protein